MEKVETCGFLLFLSQPTTHQMSFLRRSVLLSNALATRGKFSPRQGRRGAASAKRINFYKGKGGRREGRHTDMQAASRNRTPHTGREVAHSESTL